MTSTSLQADMTEKEQCITACFASLSETSRSVSDILFGITKYPTESEPNLTEEA